MKKLLEITMFALFAIVVVVLSKSPTYTLLDTDRAIISIAFKHAGERLEECRPLNADELGELPPNMRNATQCPRGRHPVHLELRTGDTVLYRKTYGSSGFWKDGKANVYKRIEVDSGSHKLFVGMNDTGSADHFDYTMIKDISLQPGRNLMIQFDEESQTFLIR